MRAHAAGSASLGKRKAAHGSPEPVQVSLKLRVTDGVLIGPGKIRLLELVRETGSISAAGRAMEMSYRRAWLLIDDLNRIFSKPVALSRLGGRDGGGADLTPFGAELVRRYRSMENRILRSSRGDLSAIAAALSKPRAGASEGSAKRRNS